MSESQQPADPALPSGPELDRLVSADDDQVGQTAFVPSDNTTMSSVLDGLAARGFTGQFVPRPGGRLLCLNCDAVSPAAEFRVESLRRLEGASDPDGMSSIVAAVCPRCGQAGTVVLGFGPTASDVDADVTVGLPPAPSSH